ncbi:hypothetical protein [Marinicella meishanensis]|uniref:hypothetical protein n=1 Tax=Marinicella meishanensis TaxID=2873263 RepID=UPI001CBEB8F5|nr:hypothetical protein [Marinicella sp. NBU2979]
MVYVLSILAGLTVMRFTFRWFFDDWQDLAENLRHWFTPEVISVMRGEWGDSLWAELRLFIWLGLGVLGGYGCYRFLLS